MRRIRLQPGETAYERHSTALQTRRVQAAVIDLWALPVVGAIVVQAMVARESTQWTPESLWAGAILVAVFPHAMETLTGRTLGKYLRRLKVVALDGAAATREQRFRRRVWTAPFLLQPVLPDAYGFVLLALVGVVIATMLRDFDGRGWPDQFAGTRVAADGRWIDRFA